MGQSDRLANSSDSASDCASLDLFSDQNILLATSLQILTSSRPGLKMGYPVAQGQPPKMRRSCTNFASVFTKFSWSIPLFHSSNFHPQHRKLFHTNLFCGVEHIPRGLVWERKFLLKKRKRSASVLQCHFWFTTKQA